MTHTGVSTDYLIGSQSLVTLCSLSSAPPCFCIVFVELMRKLHRNLLVVLFQKSPTLSFVLRGLYFESFNLTSHVILSVVSWLFCQHSTRPTCCTCTWCTGSFVSTVSTIHRDRVPLNDLGCQIYSLTQKMCACGIGIISAYCRYIVTA